MAASLLPEPSGATPASASDDVKMAGITDLPQELIEAIGWSAEESDLFSLRVVSKQIAAGIGRPYLHAHCDSLYIMLAMPSSLRRYISYIYIHINQLHPSVLSKPAMLDQPEPAASSQDAKIARQKHYPLYKRLVEGQQWLQETGNDERELREIFYWLRCSNDLAVIVGDLEPGYNIPTDFSIAANMCGGTLPCDPEWDDHRPLQIILNAIKESSVQLKKLSVSDEYYGVPLEMFAPDTGFQLLDRSFEKLTELTITLRASPADDYISKEEEVFNLVQFLAARAPNLKAFLVALSLQPGDTLGYTDINKVFELLVDHVSFPNITEFYFAGMLADYTKLLAFFARHRCTLKPYNFQDIYATDIDTDLVGEAFRTKVMDDLEALGLPRPSDTCSIFNFEAE